MRTSICPKEIDWGSALRVRSEQTTDVGMVIRTLPHTRISRADTSIWQNRSGGQASNTHRCTSPTRKKTLRFHASIDGNNLQSCGLPSADVVTTSHRRNRSRRHSCHPKSIPHGGLGRVASSGVAKRVERLRTAPMQRPAKGGMKEREMATSSFASPCGTAASPPSPPPASPPRSPPGSAPRLPVPPPRPPR